MKRRKNRMIYLSSLSTSKFKSKTALSATVVKIAAIQPEYKKDDINAINQINNQILYFVFFFIFYLMNLSTKVKYTYPANMKTKAQNIIFKISMFVFPRLLNQNLQAKKTTARNINPNINSYSISIFNFVKLIKPAKRPQHRPKMYKLQYSCSNQGEEICNIYKEFNNRANNQPDKAYNFHHFFSLKYLIIRSITRYKPSIHMVYSSITGLTRSNFSLASFLTKSSSAPKTILTALATYIPRRSNLSASVSFGLWRLHVPCKFLHNSQFISMVNNLITLIISTFKRLVSKSVYGYGDVYKMHLWITPRGLLI